MNNVMFLIAVLAVIGTADALAPEVSISVDGGTPIINGKYTDTVTVTFSVKWNMGPCFLNGCVAYYTIDGQTKEFGGYVSKQISKEGTTNISATASKSDGSTGGDSIVITIDRSITPIPTQAPGVSVQLHGEKTDVVVGEDIIFKLSAVNKITKPVMAVQVILIPPSGMSVTSSEFATSGAGQYTTTYKLEPGAGKDIEVRIKTNQQGDFNVKGEIIYYYGDDKSTAEDQMLNLSIKVRDIPNTLVPTSIPNSPSLSLWFTLLIFTLLILGFSYILKKGN
ncbi:MAG: hypothetical protein Q7J35_13870 [Candidatus Methanoperedens sp.]|nr:hypothetical protein [Candidatus Methanoperedens sp.]